MKVIREDMRGRVEQMWILLGTCRRKVRETDRIKAKTKKKKIHKLI